MLDFTWKVFSMTGAVETYLLLKELENDEEESTDINHDEGEDQLI